MKLNVFGRIVEVLREQDQWTLYTLTEGKRCRDSNFAIPTDLDQAAVITFIADIFHEFATPDNSEVTVID